VAAATIQVATHAASGPRRGLTPLRSSWLRRRRIRTKLAIILLLPVLAVVGLTGLAVAGAAGRAADADRSRGLVALGGTAARLTAVLQRERVAAALVFAEPGQATTAGFQRDTAATDELIAEFRTELRRTELPSALEQLMARLDGELSALGGLRQQVASAPDAVLSVVAFSYRAVIADLISYRQGLGQVGVSASTANGLRAAAALSQATEALSQVQVAAVQVLDAGRLTPAGQQEIVAANTGLSEGLQTFTGLGRARWAALVNARLSSGAEVLRSERLLGVVTRAQPGRALALGTSARGWAGAMRVRVDAMHAAEADIDRELLAAVAAERDAQRRSMVATIGFVAGLLVVVAAVGWWVARSLTGSLARLQTSAQLVADQRLPGMVRQLDVDNADQATIDALIAQAAEPIAVEGGDEVGAVAQAFNSVTASAVRVTESAVRLAGEQAALRASIGAILVALARRLQKRQDAMMVSLDQLQDKETDPARLTRLFELDHTATMIQRLIANLQILAGGWFSRPRDGVVPLTALLQAAGQEIVDYQRVTFARVDDDVAVHGHLADPLLHLLAELFDNAARFSPPDTHVAVEARRVGDLLRIQIRDQGTGMAQAALDLARDRIAHPGRLDQRTTRHMGLPVVAAIAARLRIRVELRSALRQGTVVDLTVPADLFTHQPPQDLPHAGDLAAAAPPVTPGPITPVWRPTPPAPPALPTRPGQEPMPAPATLSPALLFDQLVATQQGSSWFEQTADGEEPADGRDTELVGAASRATPGWAAPTVPAVPTVPAPAVRTTGSGLPVRQPQANLQASTAPPRQRPVAPPDPARVRAQLAAFTDGLNLAGRGHETTRGNQR
jgi:signal transduction histidine kinase